LKSPYTTTTTTSIFTSLSRIRGFTIDLLYLLRNKCLRSVEIAEITGKPANYVRSYLYNMRSYGLTEKRGDLWILTEYGVNFLSYIDRLDKNNNKGKRRAKVSKRRAKEEQKKSKSSEQKQFKQIPIHLWLQNSSLDDVERVVVEVLADHYNRTGSKFIHVRDKYELAERCKVNPSALGEALRNLLDDNIIYVFHHHRGPFTGLTKIGLKKAFIQMLRATNNSENRKGENSNGRTR